MHTSRKKVETKHGRAALASTHEHAQRMATAGRHGIDCLKGEVSFVCLQQLTWVPLYGWIGQLANTQISSTAMQNNGKPPATVDDLLKTIDYTFIDLPELVDGECLSAHPLQTCHAQQHKHQCNQSSDVHAVAYKCSL